MIGLVKEYCEANYIPCPNILILQNFNTIRFLLKESSFGSNDWRLAFRYLANTQWLLADVRMTSQKEFSEYKKMMSSFIDSFKNVDKQKYDWLKRGYPLVIEHLSYWRDKSHPELRKKIKSAPTLYNEDEYLYKNGFYFLDEEPFVSKYFWEFVEGTSSWGGQMYTWEKPRLKLDNILDLVEQLDMAVEKRNKQYSINKTYDLYVVGGAVSIINGYKEETTDLDCYRQYPENESPTIGNLAYSVGLENNCLGWFMDVSSFEHKGGTPSLQELLELDAFTEYKQYRCITLWTIKDAGLLYMKLLPPRNKDLAEIQQLAKKYDLKSGQEVLTFIEPYLRFFIGDVSRLALKADVAIKGEKFNYTEKHLEKIEIRGQGSYNLFYEKNTTLVFSLEKTLQNNNISDKLREQLNILKEEDMFLDGCISLHNGIKWDNGFEIDGTDLFYLVELQNQG